MIFESIERYFDCRLVVSDDSVVVEYSQVVGNMVTGVVVVEYSQVVGNMVAGFSGFISKVFYFVSFRCVMFRFCCVS